MNAHRAHTLASHNARGHLLAAVALVTLLSACSVDEALAVKDPKQAQCGDAPDIHTGRAYYYTTADGTGNCGFDATPNDLMVAAMNTPDYAGSFLCGSSIKVTGPKGEVVVRIVDRCGGCPKGDIDLSPQAFEKIGELSQGSVVVSWQLVASAVTGPIVYHFQTESNQWWTAVQIRNHRYPVATLEYRNRQGVFTQIERANYNYFIASSGLGEGPYTFRVKDIYGHTLVDSLVAHTPGGDVLGKGQFPECGQ
ncbi:MAG TPA: expansin EXLX1 family cellulose-binding protein [Bacteroidota bacterium]|nr:expansin EXLX1 family cellulose-binding protein [Bacteroidota bacterium]